MDEYGTLLGRLVCFYLRHGEAEFSWKEQYPLLGAQEACLDDLRDVLARENATPEDIQAGFDNTIKELFLWEEELSLMDEMGCPVQRFLISASIAKGAKGFMNVKEIGRLIAKLMYGIRACVYTELIVKSQSRRRRNCVNKDLGGMGIYVQDLAQTPFGFLKETMHLAAYISGDGSSLPQICWLGKGEYRALAIHGKKVELQELCDLTTTLLKEAEIQLNRQVKMGLKIKQWGQFQPADDMQNEDEGYSFLSTLKDEDLKGGMALADAFISNGITQAFFTKGMNSVILWNKDNCLTWLRRSKKLLETLAVLCHLLGGQPARATEMCTLRWRNSAHEQRGTYWANETMMLLARYSKTRSILGRDRPIPR